MKKQLLTLTTFILLGLSACAPDACENVICLNNGVCQTGDCECAEGFEGPNCGTEQRQAFVGTYNAEETCNLGNFAYQINITANSETRTEITLHNLGDFDFDIVGVVNANTVTFTNQTANASTINGTGELTNGTLTIDYTLTTTGGQTLTCALTGIVQE